MKNEYLPSIIIVGVVFLAAAFYYFVVPLFVQQKDQPHMNEGIYAERSNDRQQPPLPNNSTQDEHENGDQEPPLFSQNEEYSDRDESFFEDKSIVLPKAVKNLIEASNYRDLSVYDLQYLDSSELALLRNYIFALKGYAFKTEKWLRYFNQYSWYVPRYDNVIPYMNEYEIRNIDQIKVMEDRLK